MKNLSSLFVLSLLIATPAHAAFSDVSANYRYGAAVDFVQTQGIVAGYPDGTYKPDQNINRAEFTKIVVGAALGYDPGEDPSGYDIYSLTGLTFSDVEDGAWYVPFVRAAVVANIIAGYPDGTFGPQKNINFAEAAKIILLAYGYEPAAADGVAWFVPFINALSDRGAVPASLTDPAQLVTRGEMAEMIYQLEGAPEKTVGACKVAGCSSQVCVEESDPGITTCEWKDEYTCYEGAVCERQQDGECGWTMTEELQQCIDTSETATTSVGTYADFSADVVGNGQESVLFFYAAWCPYCQNHDALLTQWNGNGALTLPVYKVNYDTETELKSEYGVVQQHTFVRIDGEGKLLDTASFPSDKQLQEFLESL